MLKSGMIVFLIIFCISLGKKNNQTLSYLSIYIDFLIDHDFRKLLKCNVTSSDNPNINVLVFFYTVIIHRVLEKPNNVSNKSWVNIFTSGTPWAHWMKWKVEEMKEKWDLQSVPSFWGMCSLSLTFCLFSQPCICSR